jgi:hypothetical protein
MSTGSVERLRAGAPVAGGPLGCNYRAAGSRIGDILSGNWETGLAIRVGAVTYCHWPRVSCDPWRKRRLKAAFWPTGGGWILTLRMCRQGGPTGLTAAVEREIVRNMLPGIAALAEGEERAAVAARYRRLEAVLHSRGSEFVKNF